MTADDAAEIAARRLDGGAKWLLQLDGDIAGTGGILYHYNRPYGDVFMEIAEPFRRRGLGAFLVQELKPHLLRRRQRPRRPLQREQRRVAVHAPEGRVLAVREHRDGEDGRGGLAVRIENSAG